MSSIHPTSSVECSVHPYRFVPGTVYPPSRSCGKCQDSKRVTKKLAWSLSLLLVAVLVSYTSSSFGQQSQPARQSQSTHAEGRQLYPPIPTRDADATEQDNLRTMATNINAMRSHYFASGDAKSIASMYTQTAIYTELMPRLAMMKGRRQIENHFRELFAAHATELTSTVTSAEMVDADTQLVGGDYFVIANGKRTAGHFVQTLKREGGEWRIASHVFARPEPVTFQELSEYRGN